MCGRSEVVVASPCAAPADISGLKEAMNGETPFDEVLVYIAGVADTAVAKEMVRQQRYFMYLIKGKESALECEWCSL